MKAASLRKTHGLLRGGEDEGRPETIKTQRVALEKSQRGKELKRKLK